MPRALWLERMPRDGCHHVVAELSHPLRRCVGGSRDVLLAGFERLTPRLAMLYDQSGGCEGAVTKFRAPPALD